MDPMNAAAVSSTTTKSRIMVKKSASARGLEHPLLLQPASTAPAIITVSRQFQSDAVALMEMVMWDVLGALASAMPRGVPGVEAAVQRPCPLRGRVLVPWQAAARAGGRGPRASRRWP